MIRGIIFDFDGVLVDSEHINIEAARVAFEKFGCVLAETDNKIIAGRNPRAYVPLIIQRHGLKISSRDVIERQWKEYDKLWPTMVKLAYQMERVIRELKKAGLLLAIATSNDKLTIGKFIEKFGFENVFSVIVTESDVKKLKPDPEAYLLAKEKLGLPAKELLVVEDSEIGLQSAKSAGLNCAIIPTEHTQHHDFSKATHVLKSAEELLTLIAS